MNKYQEFLIGKCFRRFDRNNRKYLKFIAENDKIILEQDENIELVDYTLMLSNIYVETIEKILILKNENWEEVETKETISINLNFLDRTQQIKFVFKNNIADDYVINVEFVEADKEAYYKKQEQERKEALIKNAQIKHSTGADLVNIYFQPCNEQCVKTEIELWIAKGKRENHHGMLAYLPRLIGGEPEQLIAKYIMEDGTYFKAINGLAKGVYGYKIKQYDKDNNIIMDSEFNYFDIGFSSRPMGRVNR